MFAFVATVFVDVGQVDVLVWVGLTVLQLLGLNVAQKFVDVFSVRPQKRDLLTGLGLPLAWAERL